MHWIESRVPPNALLASPFMLRTYLLDQLKKRVLELESQSRINAAQAGEIAAQAAEIELLRREVFDYKR